MSPVSAISTFILLFISLVTWCDGAGFPRDQTQTGGLITYPGEKCDKSLGLEAHFHKPDTCIELEEGNGLEFTRPAVCANGTNALIAGFRGSGCDPTDKPLQAPFTAWDDRVIGWCVPPEEKINSMTFWCDGLPGVDMRKPNPPKQKGGGSMGKILGLSFGLGIPLFFAVGFFVVYKINPQFREKVKELFGSGERYIAL